MSVLPAFALLLLVVLLGVLLLATVAVLGRRHAARLDPPQSGGPDAIATPDAWREAGRRAVVELEPGDAASPFSNEPDDDGPDPRRGS